MDLIDLQIIDYRLSEKQEEQKVQLELRIESLIQNGILKNKTSNCSFVR